MLGVDTNVLIAAHKTGAAFHAAARQRMSELAQSGQPWAIPWPCVHEFYAVVTHPRVFVPPSDSAQAFAQVDAWRDAGAVPIGEGPDHLARIRDLANAGHITGPRIHDARIAAICLSHGVTELWTADRDFSRFPALRTRNPLVGSP